MLTASALVLCMSVGGALLALWIAVRYPKLAPAHPVAKMLHVVVALTVAQFAAPSAMRGVLWIGETLPLELFALFLIFLPSQVYAYLSGIWVLALLRDALQAR
jgi:hypothetical protein